MTRLVAYRRGRQTTRQGRISNAVWKSKHMQEYLHSGIVAGYVGASSRTIKMDKFVESALRRKGMGPNAIAMWMTSGHGRHMMDNPKEMKMVLDYLRDADVNVCVWSDKMHTGTLASSIKLYPYYKIEKNKRECLRRIV